MDFFCFFVVVFDGNFGSGDKLSLCVCFQICIIEFLIMFSLCAFVFYDQARLASQTGFLLIYNVVPVIKCVL